jgi:putative nucleotidyltransferase with HDIG domain
VNIDRKKVLAAFDQYAGGYNLDDVKVRLKYDHTFRVAENADRIARSIGLSEQDTDLAWLLGMLHDIGRFEQVRRYGTFQDKNSTNHAALSADILFKEGLIDAFRDDRSEDALIEKAVRLHNVLSLPSMSGREYTFCTILRDADKADILRVNCETPRTEIYDLPENAFTDSAITDEVYQSILSETSVDRRYSRTGIDFMLGHMAFVFGVVYPETLRIIKEQGYLEELLSFESNNPDTRNKMVRVRDTIHSYVERRISQNTVLNQ